MINLFKKKKRYFLVVTRSDSNGSIATSQVNIINTKGNFPSRRSINRIVEKDCDFTDTVVLNIIEFKSKKDFDSYNAIDD